MKDPAKYWENSANDVHWFTDNGDPTLVHGTEPYEYRWFSGRTTNTSYNALDLQIKQGRGSQTAIIHDSPVTGTQRHITYNELLEEVSQLAGALSDKGINKGDTVMLYMPMIPEAAVAMLACARIGAIHCVVFGGFAANELAKRINQVKPKLLFTASCGIEKGKSLMYRPIIKEAIALSEEGARAALKDIVLVQREGREAELEEGDYSWSEFLQQHGRDQACVPVEATHPLYVIHTSGTTGQPKGVVRQNGGHLVSLKWSMSNIFNIQPGEVFWSASDIGWVVGHSYIIYAPLLHGATSVIYEGKPVGTPDAGAFWRVIEEHNVVTMFTAPTAMRAIKKEDPNGNLVKKHDISKLRALFLAGERADPDTIRFTQAVSGVPVVDHYWQTETGFPIIANCLGIEELPIKAGSSTKPVPGYDIDVLDDDGNAVGPDVVGNLAIKLPLPPCSLTTLWKDQKRFVQSYMTRFPGYYDTTDAGYKDEEGYIFIMSRTDDVINVAGHRLSSGALEEALSSHSLIAEAAVVACDDDLKGSLPLGLVVLNDGVQLVGSETTGDRVNEEELRDELKQAVRKQVGAIASLKDVIFVSRLPKTRSGKILRATLKKMLAKEVFTVPATIEDEAVLAEVRGALEGRGL